MLEFAYFAMACIGLFCLIAIVGFLIELSKELKTIKETLIAIENKYVRNI